ncbi:MAG: purine-binding chemotaxis protein CheW [Pleurocapsa sp. CRU_1_2]|nr:purine-binding chemotaxis protein CheW [Pleurocapsa sp. CRU_1_2]
MVPSKNTNLEQRSIFQQRANDLKHSNENPVLEKLVSLVVIALDGNVLGIDSAYVHEFVDISKVSPIPCCPPYIVGNMNLRGEILTLIDIRQMLGLPNTTLPSGSVAMVVKVEDITAGIFVDEVRDAMFLLNPRSIQSASTSGLLSNIEYIQGTALYHHEQIMSLLNLSKFFIKGGLLMGEIA